MAKVASQLRSAQYMTFGATTWSPGARARKQAVAALMPDENTSALGASFQGGERCLGLVERGIVRPRVNTSGTVAIILVALVGARHVDGRHHGLGDGVDPAHGLGGERRRRRRSVIWAPWLTIIVPYKCAYAPCVCLHPAYAAITITLRRVARLSSTVRMIGHRNRVTHSYAMGRLRVKRTTRRVETMDVMQST